MLLRPLDAPLEAHLLVLGVPEAEVRALVGLLERGGLAALDRLALADDQALRAAGVADIKHRSAILVVREVVAGASKPSEAIAGASKPLEAAAGPLGISGGQVPHGIEEKQVGGAGTSRRQEDGRAEDKSSVKRNRTLVHRAASKFISSGVSKDATRNKWLAHLTVAAGDKPILLGVYGNQVEAEQAISKAEQLASTGKGLDEILGDIKDMQPDRSRFSSRFTGVSWNRLSSNWQVQIKVEGKVIHFGTFKDEGEAGEAADFARSSLAQGVSTALIKKHIREKTLQI